MVLAVFVIIIHAAFLLYGKCILSQDVYILAFRSTLLGQDKDMSPADYINNIKDEKIGEKYIGNQKPAITVSQNGKNITVSGSTKANHSAMSGYFLSPASGWESKAVGQAEIIEYAPHIRKIKRAKDILENKKDTKK